MLSLLIRKYLSLLYNYGVPLFLFLNRTSDLVNQTSNLLQSAMKMATLIGRIIFLRWMTVFLSVVGASTYKLIRRSPEKPHKKTFTELVDILSTHFRPTPSVIVEHFKFHSRFRKPGELRTFGGINDDIQKRLLAESDQEGCYPRAEYGGSLSWS